jgi:hypothetical protein
MEEETPAEIAKRVRASVNQGLKGSTMAVKRTEWDRVLPNMMKDDEGIPSLPGGPILYRCPVPGGWLVATGKGEGAGMAFVPDPGKVWTFNKKK